MSLYVCGSKTILQTAGQARILREVARQGLLPYPAFFASTKPFGTPLAPVVLKYALTVFVIVAVPGKDAFNFIIDLASYPNLVRCSGSDCRPHAEITCTDISLCDGYWDMDTSQKKGTCESSSLNLPSPEHYCLAFSAMCHLFIDHAVVCHSYHSTCSYSYILCDRVPPEPGYSDVSFWYAT